MCGGCIPRPPPGIVGLITTVVHLLHAAQLRMLDLAEQEYIKQLAQVYGTAASSGQASAPVNPGA